MHITILGKRWSFRRAPNIGDSGGYCDPPDKKNKAIVVWAGLRGERELQCTLHEMLHASDWHKDEEWVNEVADDIGHALWRLGYRKDK